MRLNWIALRRGLASARRTAGFSEAELALRIKSQRSTIYRIENVAKDPTHRPDLDTIDRWLDATKGGSLSAFLDQHQTERVADDDDQSEVRDEVRPGVLSPRDAEHFDRLFDRLCSTLLNLSVGLATAVAELQSMRAARLARRPMDTLDAADETVGDDQADPREGRADVARSVSSS